MGLLDSIFGGGGGSADDPYADILTPAQRNQMQVNGLLAMAGAFADAGMPSRLPIPFGSALGKAAQALGTGQDAGMKQALENALAAQKVRDLRNTAEFRNKLLGDVDPESPVGKALAVINAPGFTAAPGATPAGATPPAGTYAGTGTSGVLRPTPAEAGAPLTMDLPYPNAPGGGLIGSDVGAEGEYGGGQKVGGLLGPGPPAEQRAGAAGGSVAAQLARGVPARQLDLRANFPADEGTSGSSTAPAEPAPGAGGDEPWGPTFPQQAASRTGPARGETPEMTRLIEQAAAQRGVSPDVLRGLIKVESGFKPNIVSPAGAVGLAQLMPGTARGLGVTDSTDPAQAIPAAAQYLRQGLDAQGGDINRALMYYHGGPDTRQWGPKTQAYPGAVLAAAGGAPPAAAAEEPVGWGPTFAQGGPDRVIPSGSGTSGFMRAQYAAPGAGGAPGAAPLPGAAPGAGMPGGPPLYPAAPPAGNQAAVSTLLLELARRNAAAEVLGLGNPYGSLLTVLQGSPQYKGQVEAAMEEARRRVGLGYVKEESRLKSEAELPSLITRDASKGVIDQINKQAEQLGAAALEPATILMNDGKGGTIERQGTRYQQMLAANGFSVPELGIKGMYPPPTPGQTPNVPGLALPGAAPRPTPAPVPEGDVPAAGTPAGKPVLTPGQTRSQETGAAAGWKALEDTHAAELNANRHDQQLGQMAEAMQGFTPGASAELRTRGAAILKDLGLIKGDEVPSAETFQRAARQLQINAAPKGQGSTSNYERELYAEAVPAIVNSPESLAKAIGIAQRLNAYDRQIAAIHRDSMVNGVPNIVEAQRQIAKLGPPLAPGEISALEQIRAGKVPSPQTSPTRQWKEGDIVNYPDGSRQVVRGGQWIKIPPPGQ